MIFNLKTALLRLFALILIILSFKTVVNAQQKPNVIFILGDDVGYDLLSINGNKSYSTPNLDSMAHHGINFTHCESTPLCSPSRCMLLTGKYNLRNYSNWGYLSDTAKTFGNVMHDAGYKTGFFGKLQLPLLDSTMAKWGFDKYTIFNVTEDSIPLQRYKDPTLIDNNGRVSQTEVKDKYCDDILTSRINEFIDSNINRPFFIYYSMSVAHQPFSPTPADSAFEGWDARKKESDTSFFHSMIERMDYEVGLILKELARTGLDKNTIVIYSGDNGTDQTVFYNVDSLVNVGGEKARTIERGTHVPLITYWPTHISEDQVNDDLIDFSDFLPTFAEAGSNEDLHKYGELDGVSFYKRMLGIEDTAKQQLFCHYDAHPGFDMLKRWVRDKVYKLYDTTAGNSTYLFYNIVNDPMEKHPLNDLKLTSKQKAIEEKFEYILDSIKTWPAAPVLVNPVVKNLSPNSVTLEATISSSGSSALIDRGSNLSKGVLQCVLGFNRLRDSLKLSLGTFSQTRTGLYNQTLYSYSLYAMNANASHSTGYVSGTFYTLSQPPVSQPSYFKACNDNSGILLSWGSAIFPSSGATLRGYAIFYSTNDIVLSQNPNGKGLSTLTTNGKLLYFDTSRSSGKLKTSIRISSLVKELTYHFLLVPYTYNGVTDSTYNYLIAGALTTTGTPTGKPLSLNFTESNPDCFDNNTGLIKGFASNGTLPYIFRLNDETYSTDSIFNNLSAGSYLLEVKDANGCLDSTSIVLTAPSKVQLSLSEKNTDCIPDGKIIAAATGGVPPYLFSFNNGDFDTTTHFTKLVKGNYSIAVEDSDKCTVSETAEVSTTNENCATDITISPNPSNSFFKITVSANLISSHIKITAYDERGRLVYSDHGTQITSYKFGNSFEPGIYLVKVEADSNKYVFRIIKN